MPENEIDIEHRLTKVESTVSSIGDDVQQLKSDNTVLHELATSVAVMANKMGVVERSMDEIKTTITGIKEKPEKRMDGIVDKIISCIISAILAYIAVRVGLQ